MALELLAPAKNLEQGILALRCGADALYVGGPQFGARHGASNELSDLAKLVREAHLWRARVFVTLNTILYEGELEEARRMAWALWDLGVDALILQDMAFLEMDLPDIALHASTQAVCDSPEKVAFLASQGFSRAILARELSILEMRAIHAASDIELEAFVYGALCVSESGRCALSQAVSGRSANRGDCSQVCRSSWDLVDSQGTVLLGERPLLSIQDLDLGDQLEALAEAGIQSFKIEGRLKDADYVKNVVGHLRGKLDALLERRPELGRASSGRVHREFQPDPSKTFQRGHTEYRLDGQRRSVATGDATGHLGELIGIVRSLAGDRLVLDRDHDLHNGDGLAFLDSAGKVMGTLVNGVEGRQVFVQDPSRLRPGALLHRNLDHLWLKQLRNAKVDRRIDAWARLDFPEGQARLSLRDEDGCEVEIRHPGPFEAPRDAQAFEKTAAESLGKLGDTPFRLAGSEIEPLGFLPLSRLNGLRREATEALVAERLRLHPREGRRSPDPNPKPLPTKTLDLHWNVSNTLSRRFYEKHGAQVLEPAAELQEEHLGGLMMTTRLCLRFELGWCHLHPNPDPWAKLEDPGERVFLRNGEHLLRCHFDCASCRMKLYLEA